MIENEKLQDTLEKKFLKKSLLASLLLHVILAFSSFFSFFSKTPRQFNSITAELYIPIEADKMKSLALKSKVKEEKTLVNKNTLPQLPEKFIIKEEEEIKKPPPAIKHSLEETEEKKEEKEKEKREAIELTKKEALKRLLREKARLEKQNADQDKLALQEKLDQLASLKKNKMKNTASSGSTSSLDEDYAALLQQSLHENYEIPDAFDIGRKNHEVLLEITLSRAGEVLSARVISSSRNELFDQLALNTVWKASPFSEPPREWAGRPITIHFKP